MNYFKASDIKMRTVDVDTGLQEFGQESESDEGPVKDDDSRKGQKSKGGRKIKTKEVD